MAVYLGEPGMPKPHAVPDPAPALRADFRALIGAEVDVEVREPSGPGLGRIVIVGRWDGQQVVIDEIDTTEAA